MRDTHNWVQHLIGRSITSVRLAVLPEHVARYHLATRMHGVDRSPVYDEALGHFDLDAIDPNVGRDLLRDFLRQHLSDDKLAAVRRREQRERAEIEKLARHWPAVRRFLRTLS